MSDPSPPVLPDAILGPASAPEGESGGVALLPPGREAKDTGAITPQSSKKSRDTALIAQRDAKVRARAQRVELANGLAPYIDDTGKPLEGVEVDPKTGRPKGWTAVQHQIAKDSRRPIKVQPGYIAQQLRVAESYRKAESEVEKAPTINAELVQVHVSVENYPRRRLSDD